MRSQCFVIMVITYVLVMNFKQAIRSGYSDSSVTTMFERSREVQPVNFFLSLLWVRLLKRWRPMKFQSNTVSTKDGFGLSVYSYAILWYFHKAVFNLGQFAMPETCENWLDLVNSCAHHARQTHGIFQVLPYLMDFKVLGELWNPLSRTVLSKRSFIWNKRPVKICNGSKTQQ